MQCERFHGLLESYLDERMAESERQAWRQHLADCDDCREWALAQEPSLLFATLTKPTAAPAQVDRCVAAVSTLIRQERLDTRLRRPLRTRSRWLAAAALVLIMIAAAVLWMSGPPAGLGGGAGSVVAEETTIEAPAPEVEVDMEGEGVRAYYFAADEDDSMAVAFVVNPALEL